MGRYGIIAIGYNRPDSMKRLLSALDNVNYGDARDVLLIISIDNAGTDSVEKVAKAFEWKHGEKKVITYEKRQGLRNHILNCGSYMEKFNIDAVAVFEDDIIPSPAFYNYMKQTVEFYKDDDNIAGISLYTHLWNVNASMPFSPVSGFADIYFMQFAQSWGQIWMKKQWKRFAEWYKNNNEEFTVCDGVPDFVAGWPKTSWLKYHIRYCVENNKYFVYPYMSLATCFTDVGEHNGRHNTMYQVPIEHDYNKVYNLEHLGDSSVVYDSFFEREKMANWIGYDDKDVCLDLYATKHDFKGKRILVSTAEYPFKLVKSFALELKPHEENIRYEIKGNDIFVYELPESFEGIAGKKKHLDDVTFYYFRFGMSYQYMIKTLVRRIKNKIKHMIKSRE